MEGRQPSIEELLNTIQFFKKALEFYANEDNYQPIIGGVSIASGDGGHQARFALEQHKNISDYNDMVIVQSEKIIKEIDGVKEEKLNKSIIDMLKEYKKIK